MGMLMRRHFAGKKEDGNGKLASPADGKDTVSETPDTSSPKRGRPKKKE